MTDLPLSRPLKVATVPAEGVDVDVAPTAGELAALADFNQYVVSIERFVAKLQATPLGRDGLLVRGALDADVTRACTLTLEPFAETIADEIEVRFIPGASPDDLRDGAPEPLEGGEVDLGALVAEFFTLALDPYPRKPGAVFQAPSDGAPDSPFAVLKALPNGDPEKGS